MLILLAGCGSDEGADGDQAAAAAGQVSAPVAAADENEGQTTQAAAPNRPAAIDPEIGEINFALGITPEYKPVDEGIFFTKGLTEMHAIFEYSGMSPDYTWERVWYLNDQEIGRAAEPWNGPEAGVFDYLVDNGGSPLPAGDWVLELYVEGELEAIGVFIIEESQ